MLATATQEIEFKQGGKNSLFQFCLLQLQVVIISAVLGVVVGWSVSAVAFIPFALYVLTQPNLFRWFTILGTSLIASITLLAVTDSYFYGKFTVGTCLHSLPTQKTPLWNVCPSYVSHSMLFSSWQFRQITLNT